MTSRKNILKIGGSLMVFVLLTISIFIQESTSDDRNQPSEMSQAQQRERAHDRTIVKARERKAYRSTVSIRSQNLLELKDRWEQMTAREADPDEIRSLSSESVRVLSCSQELIDLIEFLHNHKIQNNVSDEMQTFLESEDGSDARRLLADLPDTKSPESGFNYLELWSEAAGRGCSEQEYLEIGVKLQSLKCQQDLLFGRSQTVVKNDALKGFSMATEQLNKGIPTVNAHRVLVKLANLLPEQSDFAVIEQLLNKVDPNNESLPENQARTVMMHKWAQLDAAAAANFIMSDPERYGVHLIHPIADVVLVRELWNGIQWVQTFPDGPYFDVAARIAVDYLREKYPNEAEQLAKLIGNKEIRERVLKRVNSPTEEVGGN